MSNKMPLAQLPSSTVKLIGSSQIITSVYSVVKELMENAMDAGSHHIEIKLEKHGLEKIEVKDDGSGIEKRDVMVICLPSYTSKISDFSDLDNLSSYGFRGEALSAICNVAQVCVTTKTEEDDIATSYTYNHNGQVVCSKISHITKGTIVTVTDLFKNLPVRKQLMSSSKRAAEELKKVEKVVKSLAMVHPRLRVTLIHNKFMIWQKASVANLRQAVTQVISFNIVKHLHYILHSTQEIRLEMLVPKRDCDISSVCFGNQSDASYLFVNNRPIYNKEVRKVIYNKLSEYFGVYIPVNKYPVSVTSLTLPPDCLDVNLEPNKTLVYFKDLDGVLEIIKQCMFLYYGDKDKKAEEDDSSDTKSRKKRKVENESPDTESKFALQETCTNKTSGECNSTREDTDDKNLMSLVNNILSENNEILNTTANVELKSENEISQSRLYMDYELGQKCMKRDDNFKTIEEDYSIANVDDYNNIHKAPSTNHFEKNGPTVNKLNGIAIAPSKNNDHNVKNNVRESKSSDQVDKFEDKLALFTSENDVDYSKNNCPKKLKDGDNNSFIIKDDSNIENTNIHCRVWEQNDSSDSLEGKSENIKNVKEKNDTQLSLDRFLDKNNSSLVQDETQHDIQTNDEDVMIFENIKPNFEHVSSIEKGSVEISPPTLSQWSRGEVMTSSGVQIKGSSVLTNSPAVSSQISQDPSDRSVSSQMGCKEMSAFTKFARNIRKEILAEHPNMSFTRVAQQLQVQWRHLNEKEKKKYRETVNVTKDSVRENKKSDLVFTSSVSNKKPDIELEVNMDMLNQMVKTSTMKKKNEIHLVGQLESSQLWLYCTCRTDLTVVSVLRLMEAVKFHKYLTIFNVPVKLLDHFIPINSRDVGDSQWKVLLDLERSPNGVIKDNRLVNNGFYVEIIEGEVEAHLLYVPQNISYCGLEELKEILELIQKHGSEASLMQCRPLKVISFLRSEVMRECSQEEQPTDPEHVGDLLGYWLSHVNPYSQSCIHHEQVTQPLEIT